MTGCMVDPLTGSLRMAAKLAGAQVEPQVSAIPGVSATTWLLRQRNALLDWMFYDVAALTPQERAKVAEPSLVAGAILVLSPSGGRAPQYYPSIEDLAISVDRHVRVATLAGVGSSALGAAALARNVADAVGEPVLTIISDYTVMDAMAEAMGGWLYFETARRLSDPARLGDRTLLQSGRDVDTLASMLADSRFDLRLLIGHSKGGASISNALYRQLRLARQEDAPDLDYSRLIITLGGAVVMPKGHTVIDVLGDFDALGWFNSDPRATIERRQPMAGHHTNTLAPAHLNVRDVVAKVLGDLAENECWALGSTPGPRFLLPEAAQAVD